MHLAEKTCNSWFKTCFYRRSALFSINLLVRRLVLTVLFRHGIYTIQRSIKCKTLWRCTAIKILSVFRPTSTFAHYWWISVSNQHTLACRFQSILAVYLVPFRSSYSMKLRRPSLWAWCNTMETWSCPPDSWSLLRQFTEPAERSSQRTASPPLPAQKHRSLDM